MLTCPFVDDNPMTQVVRNPMHTRLLAFALALLFGTSLTSAQAVRSLSFEEIVTTADRVFLGQVVAVRPTWETSPQGKHIVSVVTFKVDRVLKGQFGPEIQLEFLGGDIGGLVMEVDGMPQFRAGDRDVLFLSATPRAVSPLVGFHQGRFRIADDRVNRTTRVLTHDGRAFTSLSGDISRRSVLPRAPGPMAYADFEALVLQTLAQAAGGRR